MENTQKNFIIFIAAFLAIIIPIPGRFVYGFTIVVELVFLVLFGTLINHLVNKLKIETLRTVTILYSLIALTMLYRQIFVLLCPEVALVLSFTFYLPTISLFLIGSIFKNEKTTLKDDFLANMRDVLIISIAGLIFSLFRDILGYGTFTFFGAGHQIKEYLLTSSIRVGIFGFFASIPGALFLAGIIFFVQIFLHGKFNMYRNVEKQNIIKDEKGEGSK